MLLPDPDYQCLPVRLPRKLLRSEMKMTKMMAVALVLACLVSANTVSGEDFLEANRRIVEALLHSRI